MRSFKDSSQFEIRGQIIDSRLDEKIDSVAGFQTFPTLLIPQNAEWRSMNRWAKQVDFSS
jgi:hypothetical protein